MTVGTGASAITSTTLVPRPVLFDAENQRRSEHYAVRTAILADDFAELATQWMEEAYGEEQVRTWGPPDTTLNPLASQTRQLTTPGLYGISPKVNGTGALLGPDGLLAKVGFWSRSQWLQYMTVGIGVYFRRVGVTWDVDQATGERANHRLTDRLVNPANVVVFVDEYNCIQKLWELRLRERLGNDGSVERFWLWDQWDVSNPASPSLRVVEAGLTGTVGRDVSVDWLVLPDGSRGALVGDAYEWRDPDGKPFLPWVTYRATDGGDFWTSWRRAMHGGTLRACAYWTFTSRSALFSTGEHHIIGGVDTGSMPGADTKRGDGNRESAAAPQLTMRVSPGMITMVPVKANQQLTDISIGPGVNLPNLQAFASTYGWLMAMAEGITSDAMRTGANPTSGAALAISATQRREFSAQVTPLFSAADIECMTKFAWMLRIAGVDVPDTGYSIEYHTIPLSPGEQADERAQLEWEEDRGQLSPIDLHMRLHPGQTREQAIEALVAARADAAEIEAMVEEELVRRGIKKPKPPPPPQLFPPGNTDAEPDVDPESGPEPDDTEPPEPADGEED